MFLETLDGVAKRYIGIASLADIRSALAKKYRWLEDEYTRRYSPSELAEMLGSDDDLRSSILSGKVPSSDLPFYLLEKIVNRFLSALQMRDEQGLLFSTALDRQIDLDKGNFSENLCNDFEDNSMCSAR